MTHTLPMEIERKYLLRACPPEAAKQVAILIEQGWLPGTMIRERLRRSVSANGDVRLTRTIKLGPIGARVEVEEDTDPQLFDALWPLIRRDSSDAKNSARRAMSSGVTASGIA